MSRRSGFRNSVEASIANAIIGSLEHAPRGMAERLGLACARTLDRAIPRLRRTAERNLAFAYPDNDAAWRTRIIDGVFTSIGRLLTAFARFPEINPSNVREWIEYEGFEHFERAKLRGRGVLFATAHLGNWELSAFAHALMAEPMSVVVRPLDNPFIDEIVERRRALSGNILLSKRDFARSILQGLRNNQAVGILVDQNSAVENGAFVPFFGQLTCAGTAFAKFAARSGAAVIPGFAVWCAERGKYVLKFYPELEITGDVTADTAAVQRAVEAAVRAYPDQWLWIHRRWKTRPDGAPSLYD